MSVSGHCSASESRRGRQSGSRCSECSCRGSLRCRALPLWRHCLTLFCVRAEYGAHKRSRFSVCSGCWQEDKECLHSKVSMKSNSGRGPRLLPRMRVLCGEDIALGPGKVDLLALIGETGSIREAAEREREHGDSGEAGVL